MYYLHSPCMHQLAFMEALVCSWWCWIYFDTSVTSHGQILVALYQNDIISTPLKLPIDWYHTCSKSQNLLRPCVLYCIMTCWQCTEQTCNVAYNIQVQHQASMACHSLLVVPVHQPLHRLTFQSLATETNWKIVPSALFISKGFCLENELSKLPGTLEKLQLYQFDRSAIPKYFHYTFYKSIVSVVVTAHKPISHKKKIEFHQCHMLCPLQVLRHRIVEDETRRKLKFKKCNKYAAI